MFIHLLIFKMFYTVTIKRKQCYIKPDLPGPKVFVFNRFHCPVRAMMNLCKDEFNSGWTHCDSFESQDLKLN